MNLLDKILFNDNYKKLLVDNLKSENKWARITTKLVLFLLGGIAFGTYFVGALDFQLIAHDHHKQSMLIASTALALVFGTLLLVGLSLIKTINTKLNSKWAALAYLGIFIAAVIAFIFMIYAAVSFVKFK